MSDQNVKNPESEMKNNEKDRTERKKQNFLDTTVLIRSIQRSEGNLDCFLTGKEDCEEVDCAWRPYCLKEETSLQRKEGDRLKR
jgi:hypothetical protein